MCHILSIFGRLKYLLFCCFENVSNYSEPSQTLSSYYKIFVNLIDMKWFFIIILLCLFLISSVIDVLFIDH